MFYCPEQDERSPGKPWRHLGHMSAYPSFWLEQAPGNSVTVLGPTFRASLIPSRGKFLRFRALCAPGAAGAAAGAALAALFVARATNGTPRRPGAIL